MRRQCSEEQRRFAVSYMLGPGSGSAALHPSGKRREFLAREPEPFSREPGTERSAVKGYPGPSTKCCEAPNASLRTHHSKSLCQTSDASAPPHCGAWPEGGVAPPLTGGLVGVRFSDGCGCMWSSRLGAASLGALPLIERT